MVILKNSAFSLLDSFGLNGQERINSYNEDENIQPYYIHITITCSEFHSSSFFGEVFHK